MGAALAVAAAAWLELRAPQPTAPRARGATTARAPQSPAAGAGGAAAAQPSTANASRTGGQAPRPASTAEPRTAAAEPSPSQALREVRALVDQGKIGAARDLAEAYLKRIPDSPEAAQIESLTGVHPHR